MQKNDQTFVQANDDVYVAIDSGTSTTYKESVLQFQHGSVTRWAIEKDNVANADFFIRRYNSSGVLQDSPLKIEGANGNVTLTQTGTFKIAYDASNYMTFGVAANGVSAITVVGSADSLELTNGDGNIILDAGADIDLDPAGNDINILGAAAGKITCAATSVTIYGGDTAADDIVLIANTTDTNDFLSIAGTGDAELSTSTGKIILDAKTDIDLDPEGADINLLGAGAGKITMAATTVSIYGGDTTGDDLILYGNSADSTALSVLGTTGVTIAGTNTTGLNISGSTTTALNIALGAAVEGITIDAGTVNHAGDGSIIDLNIDVEGAYSVNAINVNFDFETTGMGAADTCSILTADINEVVVGTNGAIMYGSNVTMTGFATGRADLIGHLVTIDGTKNQGDMEVAFKTVVTATVNHSGEFLYGQHLNLSGMTLTDGTVYGSYIDCSFTNGSASYGLYVDMGTSATTGIHIAGTAATGIYIAKTTLLPLAIGVFGDASGHQISDTSLVSIGLFPEVASGTTLGAGVVAYGIRNRFLINAAQTNNVSIYGTQGQIRIKANLAAGVHSGLFGYLEQSGSVTLSSSGSFNSACNLGVETDASLTLDAGVQLEGLTISSLINTGGTLNGEMNGIHILKSSGSQDWDDGILIEDAVQGINYGDMTSFLYSAGTVTNFFYASADSKGGAGATRATPNQTATCDGSITVLIGAKTLLIPLYNAVTIA